MTFSSPQSLMYTILRGRSHVARATWALSSPINTAKSLNCRILSAGRYVGRLAMEVITSIPEKWNSHRSIDTCTYYESNFCSVD